MPIKSSSSIEFTNPVNYFVKLGKYMVKIIPYIWFGSYNLHTLHNILHNDYVIWNYFSLHSRSSIWLVILFVENGADSRTYDTYGMDQTILFRIW